MANSTDVVIIGAGPYGLSLAAHLRAAGVDFRIFGKPLESWREHMPKGMFLKSEGFASNLSAPGRRSTIKAFCAERGILYDDRAVPVALDTFLDYGDWFRARHVPNLEEVFVSSVERAGDGFAVTLESGEKIDARAVVVAAGISSFAYTPAELAGLPKDAVSHSYDHRTYEQFKGKTVAVIGAGSSAIDLAWELHEAGAKPHIVARSDALKYNIDPSPNAEALSYRLKNPPSTIGQGWKSYFCSKMPLAVYHLPARLRARAVRSHMHPAAGWFMRENVESMVPRTMGVTIAGADLAEGRPRLHLASRSGAVETLACDHVIAATGYQVDMRRAGFLSDAIRRQVSPAGGSPAMSSYFETAVPNLYTIGLMAMDSFGPLLRFMVGAEFVAPRLAGRLRRRFKKKGAKSAAAGSLAARRPLAADSL